MVGCHVVSVNVDHVVLVVLGDEMINVDQTSNLKILSLSNSKVTAI
jgi:hypothetical protein